MTVYCSLSDFKEHDEVFLVYGHFQGGRGTVIESNGIDAWLVKGTDADGTLFTRWHHPSQLAPARDGGLPT